MTAPASFHETRFPELISWGAQGGPSFLTTVVEFTTGKEQRNQEWDESRMEWDVAAGVKSQSELDELISFFRARRGRAYAFRYKDWSDFKLVDEACQNSADDSFVGDGATTVFNVVRRYEIVSPPPASTALNTEIRRIFKLRGGAGDPLSELTLAVKDNGITVSPANYTIDFDAGTITFTVAPIISHVITVTIEFDVPARFNVDKMSINIEDFNAFTWGGVLVKGINPLLEPA